MDNQEKMKKAYGWFGLKIGILGVALTVLGIISSNILAPMVFHVDTSTSSWYPFVNTIVTFYCICFPILLLTTRKDEVVRPEKHSLSFGRYLLCIPLMAGMVGVGGVIGFILNPLLTVPFGVSMSDNSTLVGVMMNSNPFLRILTAGILAPIVEEMIFRKLLIDRTMRYGEWVAVLTSGLMFGLFHGNFSQFFFATLIGGFFAYIYVRTGRVWYTIGLHMILNLSTSVITMATIKPYMSVSADKMAKYQELLDRFYASGGNDQAAYEQLVLLAGEILPKLLPFMLWMGVLSQVILLGIILWIIFLVKKKFTWKKAVDYVENGTRFAWQNLGMYLFFAYVLIDFVQYYLLMILRAKFG